MAFRRDVLKQIGGFDCALGAGTVSCGGEDTAALTTVLLVGGTIVYQPTRWSTIIAERITAALRSTLRGYGRGLTSFYASMLVHRPGGTAELLRIGGRAVIDHFSRGGRQFGELSDDFPRQLLWANRIGLLQGPFTYATAQVHARRLRRADQRDGNALRTHPESSGGRDEVAAFVRVADREYGVANDSNGRPGGRTAYSG